MSDQTILHLLHRNGKTRPNAPAYYSKVNGEWQPTTWSEYLRQVRQAARALISLGFQQGDIVTILGFNRAEWTIMDLAGMLAGGAAAGIYTSNSPSECQYIIDHAQAKFVLVEDKGQWDKIDAERDNLPTLKNIILMSGTDAPDDGMSWTWENFLAQGDEVPASEVDARLDALKMDDLATLIYTSGTTGPPKGVMLSHKNLAWTAATSMEILPVDETDCSLSYLPLSHIAEQMFTLHGPITRGYPIYFAESGLKVAENLKEVQPTIVFGVPRVWERFYNGVSARMAEAEGARAKIADWAQGVGKQVVALRNQGKEPGMLLGMQYKLADRLVFSKVKDAIGLSRVKYCVSGAAPIPTQILDFFAGLDIVIHEVYGQSEDTGPTSFNRPGNTKFGSVGPAIPGMDVKIAEDGEILARGPNVFLGYYKNEKATESTLIDGWLYSGDLGRLDEDGHLYITGRKKDIIITSGGKNVAPKNLEAAMTSLELVSSAVCIGEQQRFLTGLITLEPEAAQRFADANGLSVDELHDHPKLREALTEEIKTKVNTHFARVEQIRNFTVLPKDFSVEGGELTPTFKIKRAIVNKMYAGEIDKMYEDGQIM